MFNIGPWEFVVILVIALIVVGPKRLPELMRQLGKILAQVRNATDDLRHELKLDEELKHIQSTVRDLQDVSATAMQKLMKEVEEETQAQADETPSGPALDPNQTLLLPGDEAPAPALPAVNSLAVPAPEPSPPEPPGAPSPAATPLSSGELPKHDGKA